jgi:hypothetical protein
MGDYGKSWDRFISRHLGDWTGRSLAVTAGAKLIATTVRRPQTLSPHVRFTSLR